MQGSRNRNTERLTDKTLASVLARAKRTGKAIAISDPQLGRGTGSLRLCATPNGKGIWRFRYVNSKDVQDEIVVGVYDRGGRNGFTLKQARDRAGELSRLYQSGIRDLRDHLDHLKATERAKLEQAKREREEEARVARSGTLQALCDAYVAYLETRGKASAQDARNIFRRNITEEMPHLAAMKASAITYRDVSAILAKLLERKAGRTAGKLRAYLRAAYALALLADHDPTIPPALHGFELTANPAAAVPAKRLAQFNRARDRVLSAPELKGYMAGLDALPEGMARSALWLALLLGGQRMRQLLRLRPVDCDLDAGIVTLYDSKGNRQQPRPHVLPLTVQAATILSGVLAQTGKLPYVFTTNARVPLRVETCTMAVASISKAMLEAETARAKFELRDIRRTCETMLAAMGISRDIRAQLQSHGLGGVQQRHYDRHEYATEKRAALEAWAARLDEIKNGTTRSNVVELHAAKGATT